MPARLILNADDFGLTPGVNRAIVELHQAGTLTSATLMANGPAFDDAVAISHAHPSLGIGCHISLVDGVPLSPPQTVPSLLTDNDRNFRSSIFDFTQALLRGHIREEDIEREALAQIQKLKNAGIKITHLDTHKHTHLFPAVTRPLLRVAQRSSINAIRNPFEPDFAHSLHHGSPMRRLLVKFADSYQQRFQHLLSPDIHTTNGTFGISATGELNSQTLTEILHALPPDGIFELCCHPGYNDSDLAAISTRLRDTRDTERHALLTVIPQIMSQPNPPQLIHYGNL